MSDNENFVSGVYDNYKETQAEIFSIEIKRVRNSLFLVAGIYLASLVLGLAMANAINVQSFLFALVFPLIFSGLGFLALKQPIVSVIIAALIFIGIMILEFSVAGGQAAISGWLIKAAVVYFLFAGFQSAREAEKAKKEMV